MKHRIGRCSVVFFSIYSMSHSHEQVMPPLPKEVKTCWHFLPEHKGQWEQPRGKWQWEMYNSWEHCCFFLLREENSLNEELELDFISGVAERSLKNPISITDIISITPWKNTFQKRFTFYAIMKLKLKMNNKNQIDDCKEVSVALRTTKSILSAEFLWHLCSERNT